MFCPKCGKPIDEGNNFCANCGTPVVDKDNAPQVAKEHKKNNVGLKIAGLLIILCAIIGLVGWYKYTTFLKPDYIPDEKTISVVSKFIGEPNMANILYQKAEHARKEGRGLAAAKMYAEAAEGGSALAADRILLLVFATSLDSDFGKQRGESSIIFDSFKKSAEDGNPYGMAFYGICFNQGVGCTVDKKQAVKWVKKATDAGCPYGGVFVGLDGEKDAYNNAITALKKIAEAGNPVAMALLGCCYMEGEGNLPQSEEKAIDWLHKSAEADSIMGTTVLAMLYCDGVGIEDKVIAEKWMKKVKQSARGIISDNFLDRF